MKNLILLIAAILVYQSVHAQDYYQQTIDDTTLVDEQIFLDQIVPAPNGNFFVSGYEKWLVGFYWNYRAVVMMVDSSGNMLWNKIFDKNSSLKFKAIVPFAGGCYAVGYHDPILIKLDFEGNITGSDIIYNSNSLLTIDNMVSYDNGLLFSGHGSSNDGEDIFLFKIDSAGNLLSLGHHIFDTGFYVNGILADAPDFYLLGWMWNGGSSSTTKNGIITRFNGDGNLLWAKKLKLDGGYGRTFIRAGIVNEDRSISLVYDASDLFGANTKIGLNRIDSNGTFLLKKEFTTPLYEAIVIAGMSLSKEKEITIFGGNPAINSDDTMVVFRYDKYFNLLWSKSFDHVTSLDPLSLPYSETAGGIAETEGGNLMIAGYNSFAQKGVIKKIAPDGLGCDAQDFFVENFNKPLSILDINNHSSEDESFSQVPISLTVSSPLVSYLGCDTLVSAVIEPFHSSIHVFPNPFNQTFKLTTNANSEITIYDVAGQLLESHKTVTGEFSGGEQLTPGVYFIKVESPAGFCELIKVIMLE
ncbi:MAG TPA: T9SS type A sorting domain-containing protein [Chitinophagales bacterium]|nr:T9SS type A sorting domain-containing protein [Chitinophagales bacterium]